MVTIYNTLSGKKEQFIPIKPGELKLYVCGITPYDYAHIGHGRSYVSFDLLYRLFDFLGYDITYVRNFTDIDDKLLNKAQTLFGDKMRYPELAATYITAYTEEMTALNCMHPTVEPRVTAHIPEIITFIQELIATNKAYTAQGDVYFRISSFPSYGKLSKQKIDALRAGARVDVNVKKEDPLDFALWKSEEEGTFWQSPWGWGRPGWHIECSALAKKYLGEEFDIHGGGADLIFPHHENEIAQSEALHAPFAHYWMHNGLVRINEEKMSKSLGNFFTLKDVFKQINPMVLRFYFLNHHYRAPLDFSFKELDIAKRNYQKICKAFAPVDHKTISKDRILADTTIEQMLALLKDDLNGTGMMGILFEYLKVLVPESDRAKAVKTFLIDVLGLHLKPLPEEAVIHPPEIIALIQERELAREAKNWKRADELRDTLVRLGVELHDKKM